jgi:hypothetical protein
MKIGVLFFFLISLSAAASDETFNRSDVVSCSTSKGMLVGRILSLDSDTSADVEWMSGDQISTEFDLAKSCINITNWSNASDKI